jgi:peroxiredoxin
VDSGERISLGALKGKPVLLEFWIRNCGYCIAAVPELNTLVRRYAGTDLQVIGVNGHDGPEDIRLFYQRNQPGYRTMADKNGSIATAYGVDGFPTVVLVGRDGKVLYVGEVDRAKLETLIAAALKQP